jgi:hypothetical protein
MSAIVEQYTNTTSVMRSLPLFAKPFVAASIHSQPPFPVSTPTKPPRSRFVKSAMVEPARSCAIGPRVTVPDARSSVADFSGFA